MKIQHSILRFALLCCVPLLAATTDANRNSGRSSTFIKLEDVPETIPQISTSIKELTYADVTNQLALIQPPQANALGSAVLEFPIKLPAGRQGMTPDLNLVYNSDAGASWAGFGWNIGTPLIEVETRWGVPRYDANDETETYILDGQQLAPVAHRGQKVPREAERVFHERVETSFRRIIRHGTAPENYWWEVTATDGTTSFYGGTEENGVETTAVLLDNSGNIAQWHLVKQVDRNGNFIDYDYRVVSTSGVEGGSVQGRNVYLDKINYTGSGDEPGPFSIEFLLSPAEREDVVIDCKYGLKQVMANLLEEIRIEFNGDQVRSYRLEYVSGAFSKSLLTSVTEIDANGDEFYSHDFDYYDDVRQEGVYVPYSNQEDWQIQDDDIEGPIANPIQGVNGETSALGASGSNAKSIGSAVTVGLLDGLLWSKSNTAGGAYEFSRSDGEGLTALVDIDGDGLPDKLFKKDDQLWYRKNLAGDGLNAFDIQRRIEGVSDFNVFEATTNSIGAEAHPGGTFVGYTYSDSKHTVTTYLSDFNGDGLIDIANNGSVFFNAINDDGLPVFSTNSDLTPSPIIPGGDISGDLIEFDPMELEEAIDANPLHDIVRFWEAPEDGSVNITAPARLVENTSARAQQYGKQDGVRLTIQRGDQEIWTERIEWGDFDAKTPIGLGNVSVDRGDRIYFRVQSIFDGEYDEVIWDPEIQYNGQSETDINANGKPQYRYVASEDFTQASCQSVSLNVDGEITIEGELDKPITSDTVTVVILKIRESTAPEVVYSETIPWDSSGLFAIEVADYPVADGDNLEFFVNANTNLDWSSLHWTPRVYYSESYVDTVVVTDTDGNPLIDYCPAPTFSIFNGTSDPGEPWIAPDSGTVVTQLHSYNIAANGRIAFSIKGPRRHIHTSKHDIDDDLPSVSFDVNEGDTIYFDLHSMDVELETGAADELAAEMISLDLAGETYEVGFGVWSARPEEDIIFGPMYRNWGHFVYNGNRERADQVINEDELIVDEDLEDLADDVEDVEDPDELEGMPVNDGAKNPFVILFSDPKERRWAGSDALTYLRFDTLSSSRLGEDDLLPGVFSSVGGSLPAPRIETRSNAHSVAAGAGLTVAGSDATTRNIIDVADFNGDQFPDLVSENRVQYTTMTGGLEENVTFHGLGNHVATSQAIGATIGGEFNISNASNSGGSSGSGSNNKKNKSKSNTNKNGSKSKNSSEAAKVSVGIGGSVTRDSDGADESWLDINGDGLVDKVYEDGRVHLNIGYDFLPAENWGFTSIWQGTTEEWGVGGGVSIGNGSFQLGVSGSWTSNHVTAGLFDFNSDGLVDMITDVEPLTIRLNTGNGFGGLLEWSGVDFVNRGQADGQSASTAITVCTPIVFLGIKVCVNPSGSISSGVSRQVEQIQDVDGDGFADVLFSDNDGTLRVRRSTIGKTNLLRSVDRPLGGSIELNYTISGNTFELPYSKWVLSETFLSDGLEDDGVDTQHTSYSYSGGYHDRHEREFYGFSEVEVREHDEAGVTYRVTTQSFTNDNFYQKGVLTGVEIASSDGGIYDKIEYRYEVRDPESGAPLPPVLLDSDAGRGFPALVEVIEDYREGTSNSVTTTMRYDYDNYGNIAQYIHRGNGTPGDRMVKSTSYHEISEAYIVSIPAKISIADGKGETLREIVQLIDDRGNIIQREERLNGTEFAITNFEFDEVGNVIKEVRPENYKAERLDFTYEYDKSVQTYLVSLRDSYGYSEGWEYDPIYGLVLSYTDRNGNKWEYDYDSRGRLLRERTPYDLLAGREYLRAYQYFENAEVAYAECAHYDPEHDRDITTYAFYDGLGRQVQTKTPVALFTAEDSDDRVVLRVSGSTEFDAFGRAIREGLPFTENPGSEAIYNSGSSAFAPAVYSYDILDRVIDRTDSDGANWTYEYTIGQDPGGNNARQVKETSPLGRITETYYDTRDRNTGYRFANAEVSLEVSISYNAVSELATIFDTEGNAHEYFYDMAGRLVAEQHPDRGLTEYTFDQADNLIEKVTPNIREKIPNGGAVEYEYDFERLTEIRYPENYQNLVRLHYGEADAPFNRAGRIWLIEDASGGEELYFGLTEEITKSVRTILLSETQMQTYITEYAFDDWNRIKSIIYPDGEQLEYTYNRSGMLNSIKAIKDKVDYSIIQQTGYDMYGMEVFRKAGNGVISEWEYDPSNQKRIAGDLVLPSGERAFDQRITYNAARLIDNVLSESDDINKISGASEHEYNYDAMHRLVSANGKWSQTAEEAYRLELGYENFNLEELNLTRTSDGETDPDRSYGGPYEYGEERPNAPTRIRGIDQTYDANGNLVSAFGETNFTYRQYVWDEENRLASISDNGLVSHFTYDAFGSRVIRSRAGYQGVFVDGAPTGFVQHIDDYTIWVNGLITVTSDGFVKHYFTENERVVSKNGVGKFNHELQAGQRITAGDLDYMKRARDLRQAATDHFSSINAAPGPPTLPWYYAQPSISGSPVSAVISGSYSLAPPPGWPGPVGPPDTTGPPGPPTWFPPVVERDSLEPGYNFVTNPHVQEVEQFYYHRDVLGSTNFVTNALGELRYQVEYTPFGDIFVLSDDGREVRSNLFMDRDRDMENGQVYFEGYYYNPQTGLFANPGYGTEVAGLGQYSLFLESLDLDSMLFIDNLSDVVSTETKYLGQSGSTSAGVQLGVEGGAFGEVGAANLASNQGNDSAEEGANSKKESAQKRNAAKKPQKASRSKTLSPTQDPRDVQFKRRARQKARTGRHGKPKPIQPEQKKVQKDAARKTVRRSASASTRQKQINRQFTFAPGDISSSPGDRRAVRLGGNRFKQSTRKFQQRPGRTR